MKRLLTIGIMFASYSAWAGASGATASPDDQRDNLTISVLRNDENNILLGLSDVLPIPQRLFLLNELAAVNFELKRTLLLHESIGDRSEMLSFGCAISRALEARGIDDDREDLIDCLKYSSPPLQIRLGVIEAPTATILHWILQ